MVGISNQHRLEFDFTEPWLRVTRLAWEAHTNGNIGVGAVLTDQNGIIIAEGRNRVCDHDAPSGHLRSTFLAHAEIDVLGQLKPDDYRGHTIWTSLEPCPLCSTAIVMSNVGNVRYAAGDIMWENISRLADLNQFMADRWPTRIGPLNSPVSTFCEVLPILWFLENKPLGSVVDSYTKIHPELLKFAEWLYDDPRFGRSSNMSVETVLGEVWNDLMLLERPAIPRQNETE